MPSLDELISPLATVKERSDIGNLKGNPLRHVHLDDEQHEVEIVLGSEEGRALVIVHTLKGDMFDNVRALTNEGSDFAGFLISANRAAVNILADTLEMAATELRLQHRRNAS